MQTFGNWEMIIIDDGSTDRTFLIARSYRDPRIRVYTQKHVGIWRLGETYNKALSLARGELIAVLEGDDYWPPDKLEKQIPSFKDPDIILCWGKHIVTDSEGKILAISPRKITKSLYSIYNNNPAGKSLTFLLKKNFSGACTLVIRKKALIDIGGFKQPQKCPAVDYSTILHLALKGKFHFVNDIVGYWRQHTNQTTKIYGLDMAQAFAQYVQEFYRSLPFNIKSVLKLNENEVLSYTQDMLAASYFYQGRLALVKGEYREAILNFRKAFTLGQWSRKLKAVVGILCALTHTDLERIYRLLQRPYDYFRSPE